MLRVAYLACVWPTWVQGCDSALIKTCERAITVLNMQRGWWGYRKKFESARATRQNTLLGGLSSCEANFYGICSRLLFTTADKSRRERHSYCIIWADDLVKANWRTAYFSVRIFNMAQISFGNYIIKFCTVLIITNQNLHLESLCWLGLEIIRWIIWEILQYEFLS